MSMRAKTHEKQEDSDMVSPVCPYSPPPPLPPPLPHPPPHHHSRFRSDF